MNRLFDFTPFLQRLALITDDGSRLTYDQLQHDADLLKLYLRKERLAFCLCTNTIPSIVGYVALMQQGMATVLLDANKDVSLMEKLLDIYHPNYIWAPSERELGKVLYEYDGYCLFDYSEETTIIHRDLLLLLTTSGSTGSPKLVRLTEKNLRSNAESIATYLNIDEFERPVTTLPMYYSYGMSVINSHLMMGATILLTDKAIMQREFWNFVKNEHATSIAGVPYTYEMLRTLRFMRMDLPDMKTMIQAGGKLNAEIAREYITWAKEKGKEFIVMYGQTEAAPRMSYLPFDRAVDKCSSIGIAIPGGKFCLRDANDNEIDLPNIDGELVYMGDNVCMGYAESPDDLAKGDENHGVLHTGDVARKDEDGFYYITGRMKRFVKIWGNRVNLDALEQMVKLITSDCAVTGDDDHIVVYITNAAISDVVETNIAKKTGLNPLAFKIRVVAEIPKKSSGKTDYSELS